MTRPASQEVSSVTFAPVAETQYANCIMARIATFSCQLVHDSSQSQVPGYNAIPGARYNTPYTLNRPCGRSDPLTLRCKESEIKNVADIKLLEDFSSKLSGQELAGSHLQYRSPISQTTGSPIRKTHAIFTSTCDNLRTQHGTSSTAMLCTV